jgi:hypothetical protein
MPRAGLCQWLLSNKAAFINESYRPKAASHGTSRPRAIPQWQSASAYAVADIQIVRAVLASPYNNKSLPPICSTL